MQSHQNYRAPAFVTFGAAFLLLVATCDVKPASAAPLRDASAPAASSYGEAEVAASPAARDRRRDTEISPPIEESPMLWTCAPVPPLPRDAEMASAARP